MIKPRFAVQHWIACLGAQVDPPVGINNFYNLLGVGHVHSFAGDVEFPAVIPELNMFARFVNGTGVAYFEMKVIWLDAPEGTRVIDSLGPLQITFRPGEPLRDTVFRFQAIPIDGIGRYMLKLEQLRSRRRNRELANEYLSVVQLP